MAIPRPKCIEEVLQMSFFPFHINEVVHAYGKTSKLKPSSLLDREQVEPQDIIVISAEAKKKQILEEAKNEVLERIRGVK